MYLSVDVDAVDPAFAPAKIVGMDLVEASPPRDHADLTSMLAAHALFAGLGLLAVRESSDDQTQRQTSEEWFGA